MHLGGLGIFCLGCDGGFTDEHFISVLDWCLRDLQSGLWEVLIRFVRCICCQLFWFPCRSVSSSSLEEESVWCRCLVGASCAVTADFGVGGLGLRVFAVGWSFWCFNVESGGELEDVLGGPMLGVLLKILGCDNCINVGFRSVGKFARVFP
jgi:hypothetical protein